MRLAGTLSNEQQAKVFADYLLVAGITTKVLQETDGWGIWVRDEHHTDRAKEELAKFQKKPSDPVYGKAHHAASGIRREEDREEKKARKNFVQARQLWQPAPARAVPVTLILIFVSVAVFLFTYSGEREGSIRSALRITNYRTFDETGKQVFNLPEIRKGEVWRLFTPMFIHFTILHILFNMMWTVQLGRAIESRRGTWRFLLMVLVISAVANVAQYIASGHPNFGGMSGVVFGLFGYVWMKTRFDPRAGFYLDRNTVVFMMIFMGLCFFNVFGNVANAAHVGGLIAGCGIGYSSAWWNTRR